jgi:predicted O-linked N-acetylglucosamine transferase (SPINDLY family)
MQQAINLFHQGKFDLAAVLCETALKVCPRDFNARHLLGVLRSRQGLYEAAAKHIKDALKINGSNAEAWANLGIVYATLNRPDEALPCHERAVALGYDQPIAWASYADCTAAVCDWAKRARIAERLKTLILKRTPFPPFSALAYLDDPELLRQCAETFAVNSNQQPPLWKGEPWRNDKIKVAYLSADFRQHPMAQVMTELIERHDRSRFEIIGISFGQDDRSQLRSRIARAFDRFEDVTTTSDADVARRLIQMRVDIALDLGGYTKGNRSGGILAHRPAPVQVSYLYVGTMGHVDYILADEVSLPPEQQPFYMERIAYLPHCYFPYDRQVSIADRVPTRQEAGLPERGVVFCSFNNSWKITPAIFDVWMRLLQSEKGSVLWLLRGTKKAETNLRSEARARGIDPQRIVFAPRAQLPDHLARHRLADLSLDTLPYNAHTTTMDALWMGLPVLTCLGQAFPGRVAGSMLKAAGMPELVTTSMADYEAVAIDLATKPEKLGAIRSKISEARDAAPLFDTDRLRHSLEAAYTQMWTLWQRGEAPRSFRV